MFTVCALMFFIVMVTLQLTISQQCLCVVGSRSLYVRIVVVMGKRLGAWSAFHADFMYALANAYDLNL